MAPPGAPRALGQWLTRWIAFPAGSTIDANAACRDGSFATQRDRERVLDLVASQLQEMGYRHMAAASLKPKHVEGLVERWQAEGLTVGTIKNRMAELRWWAEKIGKQNVIARDNNHYGIGNRQYVTVAQRK